MLSLPPAWPGPRWRVPLALCALTAAVLLLHAGVLGWWQSQSGPGWQGEGQRLRQMQPLRTPVLLAPRGVPRPPAPDVATADAAAPAAQPPQPARARAQSSAPTLEPDATSRASRPTAAAAITPTEATAAPPDTEPDGEPAPEATVSPGGVQVPVYATRLPGSMTLQYSVRRGALQGRAELQWQQQDGRYELKLEHRIRGQTALGSSSQGRIDEHGIAPERHTESRRGRDQRAANFQRDTARISFSGPRLEYPLLAGAQDRLSWMLQLPAVLAANPALAEAGREISLYVVSARGDAALWVFRVQGLEAVDLPDGTQPQALHLSRDPERPYDTRVDIWLDPQAQYLPLRVLMRNRSDGPGTEWLRQAGTTP